EHGVEIGGTVFFEQGLRLGPRRGLAQEDDDLGRADHTERHRGLQHAARIEARAAAVGQRRAMDEPGRTVAPAVAADEFGAVAGPGALLSRHVEEADALAELVVPA